MYDNRTESSKMDENVNVVEARYSDSMWPNGWIVIVSLTDGDWNYGPFTTKESAIEFGKKMVNATIMRIFYPSLH